MDPILIGIGTVLGASVAGFFGAKKGNGHDDTLKRIEEKLDGLHSEAKALANRIDRLEQFTGLKPVA